LRGFPRGFVSPDDMRVELMPDNVATSRLIEPVSVRGGAGRGLGLALKRPHLRRPAKAP
jgi:hypothetical protein